MEPAATVKGRPRPALFRALGNRDLPIRVEVEDARYRREQILKHDSWAATAIFAGPAGRIICKFNRQQSIFGLPMKWAGRWLARREMRFYRLLADIPCIAPPCEQVTIDGRAQTHVAAHRYVAGHPLGETENPGEAFFAELDRCLAEIHRRGIAYMDLHKRENIVVGDDGQPYLVDFQVSYSAGRGILWPTRWLLRLFQAGDRFCLLKHKLKNADIPCTEKQARLDRECPVWIRLHRTIAVPLRTMRRRLLVWLGIRTGNGRAQSEHFTEDGLREPPPVATSPFSPTSVAC